MLNRINFYKEILFKIFADFKLIPFTTVLKSSKNEYLVFSNVFPLTFFPFLDDISEYKKAGFLRLFIFTKIFIKQNLNAFFFILIASTLWHFSLKFDFLYIEQSLEITAFQLFLLILSLLIFINEKFIKMRSKIIDFAFFILMISFSLINVLLCAHYNSLNIITILNIFCSFFLLSTLFDKRSFIFIFSINMLILISFFLINRGFIFLDFSEYIIYYFVFIMFIMIAFADYGRFFVNNIYKIVYSVISYVAHEFRTPLSAILLFIKALKNEFLQKKNEENINYSDDGYDFGRACQDVNFSDNDTENNISLNQNIRSNENLKNSNASKISLSKNLANPNIDFDTDLNVNPDFNKAFKTLFKKNENLMDNLDSIYNYTNIVLDQISLIINNIRDIKLSGISLNMLACIQKALKVIRMQFPDIKIVIDDSSVDFNVKESELVINMIVNLLYNSCFLIKDQKRIDANKCAMYKKYIEDIMKKSKVGEEIWAKNDFNDDVEDDYEEKIVNKYFGNDYYDEDKYYNERNSKKNDDNNWQNLSDFSEEKNERICKIYQTFIDEIKNKEEFFITISVRAFENSYVLRVKDNLYGIRRMHISYIFSEVFINRNFRIAIGLLFCRNVMSALGGCAACQSSEHKYFAVNCIFPKVV